MSLAKNVEFLRHFPKLNGFNGLGIYGRSASPAGQQSARRNLSEFGTNPGALKMFAYVPEQLPRAPRARRRPARLRPDRGRLRLRHRLVDARQALWLCVADARTAGLQQRQHLLQLVQSGRCRARPRRSRFDPADGRADGRRSQNRSPPHLYHRAFRRRRDDVGDAGDLSGSVRGRRHHRRSALSASPAMSAKRSAA